MEIYAIATASDAVVGYLYMTDPEQIPEHVRERLIALRASVDMDAVTRVTTFTEAVYANREGFNAEALTIAAGCANLCFRHVYHGSLYGRATGIELALRRDAGEDGTWPDAADDPEPDDRFVAVEPVEAEPVPGESEA